MDSSEDLINFEERYSEPGIPPYIDSGRTSGEPQLTQHIILDFAPNLETDCEEQRGKCIDFWDFIKTIPQFQELFPDLQKQNKPITRKTSRGSTTQNGVEIHEHSKNYCPCVTILKQIDDEEKRTKAMAAKNTCCRD